MPGFRKPEKALQMSSKLNASLQRNVLRAGAKRIMNNANLNDCPAGDVGDVRIDRGSDEIAIRVNNLSKCYQIYNSPRDRLKQFVFPRLKRFISQSQRRYYEEFWALKDVSFEVRKGETVGVIGRNGSGKSTLLQIICGTLTPTYGAIETDSRVAALLELGSGFNPEFTGIENVYMNGALMGLARREIDARFDEIAGFADIGDFIKQPVKTYSSGMMVRLAFAVSVCIDPDILILDEVLAVGDEKFQRKCFRRIENLKNEGTSILFVSHAAPQIIELCERALFLEKGLRVMYDDPKTVVRAYQKLLYAPEDEQDSKLQEYRAEDQAGNAPGEREETILLTDVSDADASDFDPGLIPETTTVYPSQGAKIDLFRIVDMRGRAVNILHMKNEYQLEISGTFTRDQSGVYFGMHFRSISGAEIMGQRFPSEGKYVGNVYTGAKFRIKYRFTMLLMPGVYFVGGGIWSANVQGCLHRILDALMIRVVTDSASGAFGYIDSFSGEPILEIE